MAVLPYGYVTKSCPGCHRFLDMNFFGVNSLLGPPIIICPGCGRQIESGRGEWADLDIAGKSWFVVFSLIAAFPVGILGGLTVFFLAQVIEGRSLSQSVKLRQEPAYIAGGILWGIAVLIIQFFRIHRSLRRTGATEDCVPVRASFWSIETGMQFKTSLILLGAGLLSGGVGWLIVLLR